MFPQTTILSGGSATVSSLRRGAGLRNQMMRRALLGMQNRKPYETPQWWPGNERREAMCCSFCGGRDHRYDDCPQRTDQAAERPTDDEGKPR
ncbi:hypothetical protein NKI77_32600 [Mesorhizobium opportunistum]|uniref:CCHC-type domain-containing protein n=1 Tax=Mesorhizobium opportunistum TaxID=593909 RepID=A0ABV1YL95_9HYPH|nr:hypothetical protein [Mesorhizobium sp.]TIN91516.1 MAG: hypothetical protein E5Y06_27305 [Mesorhizobium sp.]TJU94403.1 MAG: hypothetical protein E5Y08_30300 [Mesorhizobium sp.]TJV13202.1 MAG: hypothetical protein E5Y07_32830 [Mesorhizobium sp.]